MAPDVILTRYGGQAGPGDVHEALIKLAQDQARIKVDTVAPLTDNSGGTAGATLQRTSVTFANVAHDSNNLATQAATETALGKVTDAITELATKANAVAASTVLDFAKDIEDSSGGTSADGTIAALDLSVAGTTVGPQAAEMQTQIQKFDNAFYGLGVMINRICYSVGEDPIKFEAALKTNQTITYDATTGDIEIVDLATLATGTAADPGVTKAVVDAMLVKMAANIKLLATKLNACLTAKGVSVRVDA